VATDWIDRTVQVVKISDLTLEHWIEQFNRLKKLNAEIMGAKGRKVPAGRRTRSHGS
jgi:hypothetical protein